MSSQDSPCLNTCDKWKQQQEGAKCHKWTRCREEEGREEEKERGERQERERRERKERKGGEEKRGRGEERRRERKQEQEREEREKRGRAKAGGERKDTTNLALKQIGKVRRLAM